MPPGPDPRHWSANNCRSASRFRDVMRDVDRRFIADHEIAGLRAQARIAVAIGRVDEMRERNRLADLQNHMVATKNNQPILLKQVAQVKFAAAAKRGDASYNAKPAVILSVQKQPVADTVKLTRDIEAALRNYAANTSGGFLEQSAREYLIRNIGRTSRLADLQNLAVTAKDRKSVV